MSPSLLLQTEPNRTEPNCEAVAFSALPLQRKRRRQLLLLDGDDYLPTTAGQAICFGSMAVGAKQRAPMDNMEQQRRARHIWLAGWLRSACFTGQQEQYRLPRINSAAAMTGPPTVAAAYTFKESIKPLQRRANNRSRWQLRGIKGDFSARQPQHCCRFFEFGIAIDTAAASSIH